MSTSCVITAAAIAAISGVPGLLWRRDLLVGQYLACLFAVIAAATGLFGVAQHWHAGESAEVSWNWSVPDGEFRVALDGLSVLFLVPVQLIFVLGSVYGLSYWKQTEHARNGRKLRLFYGLLAGSMTLLLIARNAILFLVGWEVMTLSAFFLVSTEDDDEAARAAGWLYLLASHFAILCLFALFSLLRGATGSYTFGPVDEASVGAGIKTAMLVLALLGFGLKAGLMPLHVWLPSSHAIAPSHVSAIMSGVILKMGVYGLVRFTSFFESPPVTWGAVVLVIGVVSAILGVAFAISQRDLKRLLAYSSIENIGIIAIGVGLALLGRSLGRDDWILLGLAGGLLHVWSHALFKALLFLSAGSVIHATHTRDIEQFGGLAKSMPATALCFLVGAVAVCGLPPLNGFVSELLVYLGLFRAAIEGAGTAVAFAAPVLALVGALAVACFVKVFAAVFLGNRRSHHVDHAHESSATMLVPMLALAASCATLGLAPHACGPVLDQAVAAWAPERFARVPPKLADLAPLGVVSLASLTLVVALIGLAAAFAFQLQRTSVNRATTWGCGYAKPTSRMQYTSSSFAQMLVRLFAVVLRPTESSPQISAPFPSATAFHCEIQDTTLVRVMLPVFRAVAWLFTELRALQRGGLHANLLYIFLTLVVLLFCR